MIEKEGVHMKRIITLALALLLALSLFGCAKTEKQPAQTNAPPPSLRNRRS